LSRTAPRRRWPRLALVALGLGLLALIAADADPAAVWARVVAFGPAGVAAILAFYLLEFLLDTAAWQLTIERAPLRARWLARLFRVRMVGEAVNAVTPLAGMGGEPLKALLLSRHHGLGLGDSTPSLIVSRTVDLLGLVLFLIPAVVLIGREPRLAGPYQGAAGAGLAAFLLAALAFLVLQRLGLAAALGRRLARLSRAPASSARARLGAWLDERLHHLEAFDARVAGFYVERPGRFLAALALGLGNWLVGAAGTWVALALLGHPVSLAEAWIIEALTQLARAATFFVPANAGTQDGALVVVVEALTGSPELGLALALVRRFRELLWIAAGLAIGWGYTRRPAPGSSAPGTRR